VCPVSPSARESHGRSQDSLPRPIRQNFRERTRRKHGLNRLSPSPWFEPWSPHLITVMIQPRRFVNSFWTRAPTKTQPSGSPTTGASVASAQLINSCSISPQRWLATPIRSCRATPTTSGTLASTRIPYSPWQWISGALCFTRWWRLTHYQLVRPLASEARRPRRLQSGWIGGSRERGGAGRQNDVEVTADALATTLGTINYEVVTSIADRVPRIPS